MQTLTEEKIDLPDFLLEAPAVNVADLIRRNAARSIAQFGVFEKQTLVRLRQVYADAFGRMDSIIMMRGIRRRAGLPISMDETIRLGIMKREIEAEMRAIERRLREFAPDAVRKAGNLGEMAGASQLDILLREIPRIGFPRFTLISREAIEFYANYTLTTTIDYGREALAAIKRRLDLAMVMGEAWGPVARDVRRIMLEKRGMALTGLNYKANRVVRTEMSRAYQGGKTGYGKSADFVVGEKRHVNMGACDECIAIDGKEYIYSKGESPEGEIPLHPHGRCLLSAKAKVYTLGGWKRIKDIEVGEDVLTHRGRFRKVVQLRHKAKQQVDISVRVWIKKSFEERSSKGYLTTTTEHPFLSLRGWIKAEDLRVDDSIVILASRCRGCDRKIPFGRIFCTRSCLSRTIALKQWQNPEHRKNMKKKLSISMQKQFASGARDLEKVKKNLLQCSRKMFAQGIHPFQGEEVRLCTIKRNKEDLNLRQKNSERMKKYNPMFVPEFRAKATESFIKFIKLHPEKHPNHIMALKGHISSLEKLVRQFLQELDLKFESQYHLGGKWLDFALPELKIGIEADGNFWHKDKAKRLRRDHLIRSHGWQILHLVEDEITLEPELCKMKISNLVKNHSQAFEFLEVLVNSVEFLKHNRRTKTWNLSVEEDESYIANGFVVHNCFTTFLFSEKLFTGEEWEKLQPSMDVSDILAKGTIIRKKEIGIGITNPERWFFEGGISGVAKKRYFKGEVASYRIASKFGSKMFPETVIRRVGGQQYSVQRWINKTKMARELTQGRIDILMRTSRYNEMQVWDWLLGNWDRNYGNWVVGVKGEIWAIDNGFTFGSAAYYRGAGVPDFFPGFEKMMRRTPKKVLQGIASISNSRPQDLIEISGNFLELWEAKLLIARAKKIAAKVTELGLL